MELSKKPTWQTVRKSRIQVLSRADDSNRVSVGEYDGRARRSGFGSFRSRMLYQHVIFERTGTGGTPLPLTIASKEPGQARADEFANGQRRASVDQIPVGEPFVSRVGVIRRAEDSDIRNRIDEEAFGPDRRPALTQRSKE